jgi:hypothetical protein
MRLSPLLLLMGLVACPAKKGPPAADAGGELLRTKIETPPLPPGLTPPSPAVGAEPRIHPGPTKGAASPDDLGRALVEAARKRDVDAFLDLTVSARDIALFFHPGVQVRIREQVGALARKFQEHAGRIGPGGTFAGYKRGLVLDYQKGQGAKEPMLGHMGGELTVNVGGIPQKLSLDRVVRIEGRWKILDL